jgi:hypothetical protein
VVPFIGGHKSQREQWHKPEQATGTTPESLAMLAVFDGEEKPERRNTGNTKIG